MARRKKSSSQSVSLFPFLSILACVIGVLTLMITALALGQMDTEAIADLEVLEQAPKRIEEEETKAEEAKREIEKLKRQLEDSRGSAGDLQRKILVKKSELQELLEQLEKAKKDEPELPPIQVVDKEQLELRLTKLREDLEESEKSVKELEAQLAERKKPPEEAVVQVRPGGSGVDLEPTFVECAKSSIVVYSAPKPRRIRAGDIESDEQLVALRNLAANPKTGIDPKRLVPMFDKLRLNDEWFLLKLKANGRQPRLVFERKRNAGYTIEDLENPRGPYARILKSIDPSKHYLRFTVWTDSYDVYLAARRITSEHGLLAGWDITSNPNEIDIPLGGKIRFGPEPPPMPDKPKTDPPKEPPKPVPVDTID